MVAVAPGAAPPDGPSGDGSLESLFSGRGDAAERAGSAGRARSGVPETRATTIDLSAAADPVPRRRGVVPIRHIVGARPPSGRWLSRARRSARVSGWVFGAATVGAGLVALWVLLFTTVSGGDVWLGRPVAPTRHDQNATQQNPVPSGSLRPSPSAAPPAATKPATPTATSGRSGSGSATATSGGSGRNGADDPVGDDSGGTRTTASTSGSGSGSGSGGSGSDDDGSGGSGGHGSDD